MWEAGKVFWCIVSPLRIILDSLKILQSNKLVFCSIIFLTTLPLSFLTYCLSLSIHSLRHQIYHLEALALFASTRFEARHVWHESHDDALSLLRTKVLFSLPSYLLSLAAALSSVHSTVSACHGRTPTLHSTASAVKQNWKRPAVTTIFVYVFLLAFAPVPRGLAVLTESLGGPRLLALAIGSGLEVYLMAVLSMGLVVSVAEERFGWEAIRVGSGLMEGGRFCGWVLSGLLVLVSGLIGWKMKVLTATETAIGAVDKMIVICSYGLTVLCSYVITAVFYCDCRRRHPIREPEAYDHQQLEVEVEEDVSL